MNPTEQSDSERFFEALAGRESGVAGADHLRSALLAEERTLAEAETASPDDISATEMQRLDAIKARLLAGGIFSAQPATSGTEPNRVSSRGEPKADFLSRLFNWLTPPRLAPFAIAATVTLAVLIAYQSVPESTQSTNDASAIRGPDDFKLRVSNPAETVARVKSELELSGIAVVAVQINSQSWALRVTPDTADQQQIAKRILREAGVPIDQMWPVQIIVTSKEPLIYSPSTPPPGPTRDNSASAPPTRP